jgi:hypothetical protein
MGQRGGEWAGGGQKKRKEGREVSWATEENGPRWVERKGRKGEMKRELQGVFQT